ncbi:MAG: Rieske (2Fe-2S) protein [Caldilineaceae bacterium]
MAPSEFLFATDVDELKQKERVTVQLNGNTVALFWHDDRVYAVDNRCPHMGFPLDRGSVNDCILTCHWHHARFDLTSGGTFDQWADDVRAFPVQIQDGKVMVDVALHQNEVERQRGRLRVGLERDISLVLGKSVLTLMDASTDGLEPFRSALEFGTTQRWAGWGQGLTMLGCFMRLLPYLAAGDRPRALYHGLSAVARDTADSAPRYPIRPLPDDTADLATLKRWFRRFVEVRDAEGAERCIISAIRAGADDREMADMLFAAVTDHRYVDVGHPADFTNKALESLDIAGWEYADKVLPSLAMGYANASRMEESNAWRHPIDLIAVMESAFDELPAVLEEGEAHRAQGGSEWADREALTTILLDDDPQMSVDAMLDALRTGCTQDQLAAVVAYAAALRIARFHTSNEFGDWDTALHTFTFANAIHQGMRRSPSVELLRGVFDAATSVYLDRFLNIPAARLPEGRNRNERPEELLADFPVLLDQQQQVNEAGRLVADYLDAGGAAEPLLAQIGALLLREDRNFHTIQCVEAAFNQFALQTDKIAQRNTLVAAARYLAAHSPTVRAQRQTYEIARRLHDREELFEGE